jgi:CBS domain-containing protein
MPKAQDVMTKDVVTISGSATVAEAVRKMRDRKVSSLIVERRNVDDAYGIITRKDVVTKVVSPGKKLSEVKVHEIMTKPLIMMSPGLELKYCARLMAMTGIRRAPVFDGKQIVGILSNTDIFHAAAEGKL